MTDERTPHPIGGLEWGNCPKCDWYYRTSTINNCPMCRHPWRQGSGYQQPPYESPGLQ